MSFKLAKYNSNLGCISFKEFLNLKTIIFPPLADIKQQFIAPGEVSGIFHICVKPNEIVVFNGYMQLISLLIASRYLEITIPKIVIRDFMLSDRSFDNLYAEFLPSIDLSDTANTKEKLYEHVCICYEVDIKNKLKGIRCNR